MRPARHLTRRRLVQLALAGAAFGQIGRAARADQPRVLSGERWLELLNVHTGESLAVAYRTARGLVADAVSRLEHLLRDYRVNEQHPMDARLYEQLADLALAAGREPRFEVISGYRSPRTNARLAEEGRGVAPHSLHLEGRAIDVRLKGLSCADLRDLALAARRGGVGYYARSDFVHVDTGRVRTWSG
ncbi:MAG: DUF882 domain-containing protein [Steroidobacteraceae bacterium]